MFYLTMHSTHFILRLYGVKHMVKDHSDSLRGNPLPPHRLLFPFSSKGSFICTIRQPLWSTGWNEKYLNGFTMKDRSDDPSHHELIKRDSVVTTYARTLICWHQLSILLHIKFLFVFTLLYFVIHFVV